MNKKLAILIFSTLLPAFCLANEPISKEELLGLWKATQTEAYGFKTILNDDMQLTYSFNANGILTTKVNDEGIVSTGNMKYRVEDSKLFVHNGFIEAQWKILGKSATSIIIKDPVTKIHFVK